MTISTLGADSTLKSKLYTQTTIHLTAPDCRFFSELIDEDLERKGDLIDDDCIDWILNTQKGFDYAADVLQYANDDETIGIRLNEEEIDYFFYDLLQGIMYEGTAQQYLEDDAQEEWDAMEGCWMQLHPDHETRAEQIKKQEKEDAENEALAKSYGFESYKEWFGYDMAVRNGTIKETTKFGSIKEYREYKAAKIAAAKIKFPNN